MDKFEHKNVNVLHQNINKMKGQTEEKILATNMMALINKEFIKIDRKGVGTKEVNNVQEDI